MKQPSGNITMSCFNKILDCLDILEVVAQVYHEDHYQLMSVLQKKQITNHMKTAEDYATRIYPIIFADGFGYTASNRTETAVANQTKYELRKKLVLHALKFNNDKARGAKITQPPEQLTTFKPFNIREIEYEVW